MASILSHSFCYEHGLEVGACDCHTLYSKEQERGNCLAETLYKVGLYKSLEKPIQELSNLYL